MAVEEQAATLVLAVDGRRFEVATPDPSTTLLQFLRSLPDSRGPKHSCGEGGCGACAVLCSSYDLRSKSFRHASINACLAPLCSLDACSVTTSQGLLLANPHNSGNLHPVHSRIAAFHATQCGFCTPGFAVSLHSSFFSAASAASAADAHHSLVGHICRCTGYRPILDACKSLAPDADVEDLGLCWQPTPADAGGASLASLRSPPPVPDFLLQNIERLYSRPLFIRHRDGDRERIWIRAASLEAALAALREHGDGRRRVKLVVGNTSAGYYKEEQKSAEVFVDISRVPELSALAMEATPRSLKVGAAVTIENLISALEEAAETGGASAAEVSLGLASHLKKVANPLVRRRGSVGGNIVMARNRCFDSDIATLFLAIDATLEIIAEDGATVLSEVAMEEFLRRHGSPPEHEGFLLLKSVDLPLIAGDLQKTQVFRSYRASPRELGNALALVNAAFLVTLSAAAPAADIDHERGSEEATPASIISDARLAFGAFGGKSRAIRARAVERFLCGKPISAASSGSAAAAIAKQAIEILKKELEVPLKGVKKSGYRSSVAVSFLFDFLSQLMKIEGDGEAEAAEERRRRPLEGVDFMVGGKQIVPVYEEDDAIGKPIQKSEAIIQATGEAVYVDDIPSPEHCLFAGFLLSSKAFAKIKSIDATLALQSSGVVAFISAGDIPNGGKNVGSTPLMSWFLEESLFATDVVEYVGQLIGVVVADSPQHADAGVASVIVEYEELGPPLLCCEDAEKKNSFFSLPPFFTELSIGDADHGFAQADHVIRDGEVETGSQYYFYMETQAAMAVPDEDGCMVVYSSSQAPEYVQKTVSKCLGVPHNNVRVITRRVGGGFGGKVFRNIPVAAACAVAAQKLRRAVRISLDRKTDIAMSGGRHPTRTRYSVGFKRDGKVTGLRAKVMVEGGWSMDFSPVICMTVKDGMKKYNWGEMEVEVKVCKTNANSKSAMRAPGHVQGSFIADTIIENVAGVLGIDVHKVIAQNLHTEQTLATFYKESINTSSSSYTLPSLWNTIYNRFYTLHQPLISSFNACHPWHKRGLSILPCIYGVHQPSKPARVSIFHDSSILVEVGGIEIGQGLWTKVKQTTVFSLNPLLPLPQPPLNVRVVQADTFSLPHGGITADSTTSESSCEAVRLACHVLVQRLLPLKQKTEEDSSTQLSWPSLIQLAQKSQIDLSAQVHWYPDRNTSPYLNYGVAASEIELNVLTGAVTILRSEIMYDCGRSLNPAVDIGQIEGAFVQGIGFFLTEEYEVDAAGEVVSNSTWTYKPPTVDNIPRKFTVEIINGEARQNRVLSSKACGEPPLLLAGSVHSAVRHAIEAAREDRFKHSGAMHENSDDSKGGRYFRLDTPATMDKVKALCGLDNVEAFLKHLSHGEKSSSTVLPSD